MQTSYQEFPVGQVYEYGYFYPDAYPDAYSYHPAPGFYSEPVIYVDPLLQKQVRVGSLSDKDFKKHMAKNGESFAAWLVAEVNVAYESDGDTGPCEYAIDCNDLPEDVVECLKKNLVDQANNIKDHVSITLIRNGKNFPYKNANLHPVYNPFATQNSQGGAAGHESTIKKKSLNLSSFYDLYKAKGAVEICDLDVNEQIEALHFLPDPSEVFSADDEKQHLDNWKKTLKTLWENAQNDPVEQSNVKNCLEKTQAILWVLAQADKTPLTNAIIEFNQALLPFENKSSTFRVGMAFGFAVAATVLLGLLIIAMMAVSPAALALLAIPAVVGFIAGLRYAEKEVNSNERGVVSTALAKLGLFNYTPYKNASSEFKCKIKNCADYADTYNRQNNLTPGYSA